MIPSPLSFPPYTRNCAHVSFATSMCLQLSCRQATTVKLELHLRKSGSDFDTTPSSDVDRCFDFSGYEVNLRHSFTTTSSTTSVTSTSQTTTSGTSTVSSTTSSVTTTTVTAYPSVAFNELTGNTCDDTKTSSGLSSATIDECKLQCFIDSTCLGAFQRMKFEWPPFQSLNLEG